MESSSARGPPAGITDRRILTVDDDRLIRRRLTAAWRPEGFAGIEADSGEKALELNADTRRDLALPDVVLPGINGFETCRRRRGRHGDEAAPVIFITVKSESDDVVEGLSAGGERSEGLGLAICRKIVDAHHGAISAENLSTRAGVFRVTFPRQPCPTPEKS